jgi:hypothetical protein
VVGLVGAGWFVAVSVACLRTPERRRRYLPMGLAVVTLAAFVAIRLVSLHQVDSVLYRRHIEGVRVGTLIELSLLLLTSVVTCWVPGPTSGRSRDARSETERPPGICDRPALPVGPPESRPFGVRVRTGEQPEVTFLG